MKMKKLRLRESSELDGISGLESIIDLESITDEGEFFEEEGGFSEELVDEELEDEDMNIGLD